MLNWYVQGLFVHTMLLTHDSLLKQANIVLNDLNNDFR